MSAEVVISCPACQHLLRVPNDWLATKVQCPECKAMFRAPVRHEDGTLSNSVLLSEGVIPTTTARRRPDWMLLLPGFGLMLCGVIGGIVDTYSVAVLFSNQERATEFVVQQFLKFDLDPEVLNPDVKQRRQEQRAEEMLPMLRTLMVVFTILSAVTFSGGLAIVLRRGYWLAMLACPAAALNIAGLCCVPGAAFALWAVILLITPEGKDHFLSRRKIGVP